MLSKLHIRGHCTSQDMHYRPWKITTERRFCNISMITAWSAQKDKINKLECIKFAEETHHTLTMFHSHDMWAEYEKQD